MQTVIKLSETRTKAIKQSNIIQFNLEKLIVFHDIYTDHKVQSTALIQIKTDTPIHICASRIAYLERSNQHARKELNKRANSSLVSGLRKMVFTAIFLKNRSSISFLTFVMTRNINVICVFLHLYTQTKYVNYIPCWSSSLGI